MNTHLYEEIRSIEEIINENKTKSEGLYTEDDYTKLMKKEDKVLDLLDDMKKKKKRRVSFNGIFSIITNTCYHFQNFQNHNEDNYRKLQQK